MKAGVDIGNEVRESKEKIHTDFLQSEWWLFFLPFCVSPFTGINVCWKEKPLGNVGLVEDSITRRITIESDVAIVIDINW